MHHNLSNFYHKIQSHLNALEQVQREFLILDIQRKERLVNDLKESKAPRFKIDIIERQISSSYKSLEDDLFYWKLSLKYKLFASLINYIKTEDVFLDDIIIDNGPKGIQIKSQVLRLNKTYQFNTLAISAGGWNVQNYHYRYLIKTTLPKLTPTKEVVKFLKEQHQQEYNNHKYNKHTLVQEIKTSKIKIS